MAAAFSFNCPQCGKTYDNVKANMAGRKVSCTCGKVFRLGPKTEEQIAARAKRKAEKLAARQMKQAHKHPPTLPTVAAPSDSMTKHPIQPSGHAKPFEADIPGLEDDNDTKQVASSTNQQSVNPGAFEDDPLLDNPEDPVQSQPSDIKREDSNSAPPLGWALATPEPTRKTVDNTSTKTFSRKNGPIARMLDWFASLFSRQG